MESERLFQENLTHATNSDVSSQLLTVVKSEISFKISVELIFCCVDGRNGSKSLFA